MNVQHFYDRVTGTLSYVVTDNKTKHCAIIDSVMDYDPDSGNVSTQSADKIIAYIQERDLKVQWILETHIHADHLTAASYLKKKLGGKIAIGEKINHILEYWGNIFNITEEVSVTAFDKIFKEGEVFYIGELAAEVIFTPGHTPICSSYLIADAVFVGDTLFTPSRGTARADFPEGGAKLLYHSIHKLYNLPDNTRVFICHDYPDKNEEPNYVSTILEHKTSNIMVAQGISESEYIEKRQKRDKTLSVPRLILPSVQYNLRAGSFGEKHENGFQYAHIPIGLFQNVKDKINEK